MPSNERPSKEDEKEDPSTDEEPQEGREGVEENGNGHGKGRKLSKDFKERWDRLEQERDQQEEPGKEAPPQEPKPVGLGLFKLKMSERKGQKGKSGFLTPALAIAAKKAVSEGQKGLTQKGPEPKPVPPPNLPKPGPRSLETALQKEAVKLEKEVDILDNIIMDLKGHRHEFIQRRKEELRKDSERPRTDPEPYVSKLKIIKEEMEKKRKEEAKPDIFGVGFTAKQKDARVDVVPREERMKTALKASMEKTIKQGSILKRLDQVLIQPMSVIEEETEDAKQRLITEIGRLETKGFEGRVKKLLSKINRGKVFQAERDLLNLKIAMEAQRSREQLKHEREDRLEARLQSMGGPSNDLEDVVQRHIKALEIEMDQTKARIQRDLKRLDTTGFEHVVSRINDMVEEERAFDAEEQLLELRLALKARELREELKTGREERIIEKAKASMPVPVLQSQPVTPMAQGKDLLEEIEEAETAETIGEMQCGVCGTVLEEGAKACPACGTSFTSGKVEAEEKLEEMTPEAPERPEEVMPPGPPKPPEEPELSEIQCGICGSMLPEGAKRCRACGTLLVGIEQLEGEQEPEEYPSLAPIEEEESYPELGPIEEVEVHPDLVFLEEEESYPLLAPIEEQEGYPVLAPADEEEQFPEVVPGKGMKCPHCSKFSPIDSINCVNCGASLGLPLLEPVEAEEDLQELVPVGPDEEATEEYALEEGVPVAELEEEIIGEPEVEPEGVLEQETEGVEAVEAVPWSEVPAEADKELEWRRLCVRAKRFFNEGRVKAALESYDDAIEISPSFDAYYGKGEALLSLGWTNSALDCFNQALEIDEERISGWVQKAKALEALGRYTEAVDSVNRALAIDDMSSDAWHLKGTMLLQMGQVEEAVKALDRYVGIKPSPEALREAVELTKKAIAKAAEEPEEAEPVEAAGVKGVAPEEELTAVEEEELGSLRAGARARRYRTLTKQRGLTNGFALVNGRGLTNGKSLVNGRFSLINGRSKVNGLRGVTNGTGGITNGKKGLINGRGLVNGASGLVNGKAMGDVHEGIPVIRFKRARRAKAMQAIGILAIVFVAIFAPLAYFYLNPGPTGITIDGQFQDWSGTPIYDDSSVDQTANLDINIMQYGMVIDGQAVSISVSVPPGQRILNGADLGVDVVHAFLDTDGSAWTGYSIGGIGADRMLEVYGWNGKVQSASMYSFNISGGRQPDDWNGWEQGPAISAMARGSRLEAQAPLGDLGTLDPKKVVMLVHMSDMNGHEDLSDNIISHSRGTLTVSYSYLNSAKVQPGTQASPFLRLNLTARKAIMEVRSITLERVGHMVDDSGLGDVRLWADTNGNGIIEPASDVLLASGTYSGSGTVSVVLTPANPMEVQPDATTSLYVTVDLLDNLALHQTLGLDISRSDIVVKQGAVTVEKVRPCLSYIGDPTTFIVIDGQFDDWARVPSYTDAASDTGPTNIPRIDLREYRSHFDTQSVSFFLSTTGDILSGTVVPDVDKARPVGGPVNQTQPGPPPPPLPRVSGADIAIIYLDTDQDPMTGLTFPGFKFGADYMVLIEGKAGLILSSKLYKFAAQVTINWQEVKVEVPAANDRFRMETQVSRSAMGLDPYARVDAFFVMTDWQDDLDMSDTVLYGNRGDLQVRAINIIPDSILYGTADVPLMGIELQSSEDIVLLGLTFERAGNATDLDTGSVHIYLDNGDRIFNALDRTVALADSQFVKGTVNLTLDTPLVVQNGVTIMLFLASDFTLLGDKHVIGVTLDKAMVRSSAGQVLGTFPMATILAIISSTSIRSNNFGINLRDNAIDAAWGNIGANSEGYVNDDWASERRQLPGGSNIRDVEICDANNWLYFHIRMRGNLASNLHVYIDTDRNGVADYDLIYDRANAVVLLYHLVNGVWVVVNLAPVDRYDLVNPDIEMGIEWNYLNLVGGQRIRYQVRTETDTVPMGQYIDVAPGQGQHPGWSGNYRVIPEFKDVIIPIIGTIAAFGLLRQRRARSSKKTKRSVMKARRDRT